MKAYLFQRKSTGTTHAVCTRFGAVECTNKLGYGLGILSERPMDIRHTTCKNCIRKLKIKKGKPKGVWPPKEEID